MVTASDGGMGVMQVMSDTVVWLTQSVPRTAINPLRPTDNIRAGVALLRYHYGHSLVTPAWRWPPIARDKPASGPGDCCLRPSTTWPPSCPCADASPPRAPITAGETPAQPASSSLDGAVFSPGTQRRTGRVRQGVIGALGRGQCSWEARQTAGARKAAAVRCADTCLSGENRGTARARCVTPRAPRLNARTPLRSSRGGEGLQASRSACASRAPPQPWSLPLPRALVVRVRGLWPRCHPHHGQGPAPASVTQTGT